MPSTAPTPGSSRVFPPPDPRAVWSGTGLVLLSALLLSTAPAIVKVGLAEGARPLPLLAWRMVVAAVALGGVLAAFSPGRLRVSRSALAGCVLAGAANAASLSLFYVALGRLDASIAILVFSLWPAFAILLLAARGERPTRRMLVRLVLALGGVWLLVGPGGDPDPLGVALATGTAVLFAVHVNVVQWRLSGVPSRTITFWVSVTMAAILAVVVGVTGPGAPRDSPVVWGVILWTGLVSAVLARLAMFAGIHRLGSGRTALLGPVETLLTVAWAALLLGERVSGVQALGAALILASAALAAGRQRPPVPPPGDRP